MIGNRAILLTLILVGLLLPVAAFGGSEQGEVVAGVHFVGTSAELAPQSEKPLGDILGLLQADPYLNLKILVEPDTAGSDPESDQLALQRARHTRDWLTARGVDPRRLEAAAVQRDANEAATEVSAGQIRIVKVTASHPEAVFAETSHTFDPVPEGRDVIHDFILQNRGTAPLEVEKVKTG